VTVFLDYGVPLVKHNADIHFTFIMAGTFTWEGEIQNTTR